MRAHRAELAESLHAVEDALAPGPSAAPAASSAASASAGLGTAWPERLATALAELAHDLRDHVEITEGDRGLYARVRRSAPRLATPIDRLVTEHARHRSQVDGFLAVLEDGGTIGDLADFRADVATLLAELRAHRKRGRDLVHEAYDIDLGGSG